MVRSELAGDGTLSRMLDAQIDAGWPCEYWDRAAMEWTINAIDEGPMADGWGMWYWVLRPPHNPERVLIGNGGFKGPPGQDGTIEIGYSIVPEQRRHGLATEACRELIAWAWRDSRVKIIAAETFPHLQPSIGVMKKLRMTLRGEGSEPGTIRYAISRAELASVSESPAR